ncbi:hypothetical protein [Crucivirus-527]|nr:hypothetical protein [Crucivirus-527]QMW69025.1 hypothetical protein [Crucivirus-528]
MKRSWEFDLWDSDIFDKARKAIMDVRLDESKNEEIGECVDISKYNEDKWLPIEIWDIIRQLLLIVGLIHLWNTGCVCISRCYYPETPTQPIKTLFVYNRQPIKSFNGYVTWIRNKFFPFSDFEFDGLGLKVNVMWWHKKVEIDVKPSPNGPIFRINPLMARWNLVKDKGYISDRVDDNCYYDNGYLY